MSKAGAGICAYLLIALCGCASKHHSEVVPPGYVMRHYDHCIEVSRNVKTQLVTLECRDE
jgi:hypothetical protein